MSLNIHEVELPVEREIISQAAAKAMLAELERARARFARIREALNGERLQTATHRMVFAGDVLLMEEATRAAIHAANDTHAVEHVLTVHVDVDSDGSTEVVDIKLPDGTDWDGELTADEKERVSVEAYDQWRERGDPSHVYEMREEAGVGR